MPFLLAEILNFQGSTPLIGVGSFRYITSDWKNCFTQLENGEIDILGGISYTDERAENMLFSDMPMGEEKYYIYTDASNMDLTAGNLDSFEGKNIGVSKDNIVEDVLNEWESKYGLHTKHINVSTTTEIMDKLSKHEIDCFVSVEESRWEESDISPLTSIGETEIYFAINPERPDIKEALDSAMRRIKDDNPFYTDDLYRRYLSAQSSSFLSKEESEWIGQHGAIRIGYLNQDGGISSVDPSTGKLTGVITDYVDLAENCLQGQTLEFELNGYDTRSELLQALQDGKIDLIFHANQNPYFAETNGFALSDTLLTLNMAAITAKDSFDENKENIVAVEKDNFALKAYLSYNYPQWEIIEYGTSDAAVKAMQKGEADCIVSNSDTVSDYLKNNKLHSVFLTKEADVSFAVQQGEPVLLSILNKTLTSMPTTQFSGAVVSYNASSRKVTAKDFIQDNLLTVSLIAGISFFVVLCIILDSLKKSKRAEEKSKKSAEQALKLNQELEEKQQEFIPEKADGSIEIAFEINGTDLSGKTAVIYEEIKIDGKSIAEHKNPEAKEQSIYFPKIGTKAIEFFNETFEKMVYPVVEKILADLPLTDTWEYVYGNRSDIQEKNITI